MPAFAHKTKRTQPTGVAKSKKTSGSLLCRNRNLQLKLKVNIPGDHYEKEADHIADRIIRMPEKNLQRSRVYPEFKEGQLSQESQHLQFKRVRTSNMKQDSVPPIVHDALQSSGQRLQPATRTFMESRFGQDFSQVRVHVDTRGSDSANAVNAAAYTLGRDIVFGAGQYAPGTREGKRLLAHELAHVIQQTTRSNPGKTGSKMNITSANSANVIYRYVSPAVGSVDEPTTISDEARLESCSTGTVSLYGPEGVPRQEHVDQGSVTDCYVLASLAALTRTARGREHITSHIRPNPDGSYTVTLYSLGGQPEHIRMNPRFIPGGASTTPILAQSSGSPPNCIIWVALYERAVGHLRARGTSRGYYFAGMTLNTTFQMIIGSGFDSWMARGARHTEIFIPESTDREVKIPIWRSIWHSLQSGNEFVSIDTRGARLGDSRLAGPHAYSITQAYTRRETIGSTTVDNYYVDLYNPHGSHVNRVNFITGNFQRVQISALSSQA